MTHESPWLNSPKRGWGGKREGAGRSPLFDEPSGQIAFTLPDRLVDKLSKLAVRAGCEDVSLVVAQLLEDA